jgi:hypothetical protein
MLKEEFEALPDYSATMPTGVVPGNLEQKHPNRSPGGWHWWAKKLKRFF